MDAQRVRHRRLDRIGVGHRDHNAAGVPSHHAGERRGDASLHLGEGLAAGKAKPGGMTLDGLPFGLAHEPPELLSRPLADVAVGQVTVDADGQAAGAGDGAAVSRARSSCEA